MAGRVREFFMSPILLSEILEDHGYAWLSENRDTLLRYGSYPQVFDPTLRGTVEEDLSTLAGALLYKDVLELENVRKSPVITDLLTLVALQVGSEVSYSELAQKLAINVATVQKYLHLLEETFVIFQLRALSRNARNEIRKSQKVYFYDLGIRNALIRNFNPPVLRTDLGGLWENFVVAERVKYNRSQKYLVNSFFWRTYDRKEIDYVEEKDGIFTAFEVKWSPKSRSKLPKSFADAYPNTLFSVIHSENWIESCAMRQERKN
jgi:predicted AAA+ superfamily ATPase